MLSWLPENISTFGSDIDQIMYVIYYVVGAWFLLAQGILFYFVISNWNSEEDVPYVPARSWKMMAWILVPAALVMACDLTIDFWQESVWAQVKEHKPDTEHRIKINGEQFSWTFAHPGPDGELDTDDDIETRNHLHVPANKKVIFQLTSSDVIHSFWVPKLRLKQDAVPGRVITGWFEATKPGKYQLACAELCGIGHGVMKANLVVHDKQGYKQWMKKQAK